jgi:hypothetical protein
MGFIGLEKRMLQTTKGAEKVGREARHRPERERQDKSHTTITTVARERATARVPDVTTKSASQGWERKGTLPRSQNTSARQTKPVDGSTTTTRQADKHHC